MLVLPSQETVVELHKNMVGGMAAFSVSSCVHPALFQPEDSHSFVCSTQIRVATQTRDSLHGFNESFGSSRLHRGGRIFLRRGEGRAKWSSDECPVSYLPPAKATKQPRAVSVGKSACQ